MKLTLKHAIATIILLSSFAAPVAAAPFEDAVAAYDRCDYAEAARWYRLAADQGCAGAQSNLGIMCANGQGVAQDYAEAVRWYRLAADQGFASAQNNLGSMYNNDQGVPQDYVRAHVWFNLSAAQGIQDAVENRNLVAERMTPAQIAEAQRLAREWRPTTQSPR